MSPLQLNTYDKLRNRLADCLEQDYTGSDLLCSTVFHF